MIDSARTGTQSPAATTLYHQGLPLEYQLHLAPSVRDRFEISAVGSRQICIRPCDTLDRRTDVVPIAVWDVPAPHGTYEELNLMMGRLHFSPGGREPKTYQPFSHDEFRKLKALILTAETSSGLIDEKRDSAAVVRDFALRVLPDLAGRNVPDADSIFDHVAPSFEYTVGQTDFAELAWLYVLAQTRPARDRSILEIGSFQGRSTFVLASAMRCDPATANLISIDPHQEVPQHRDMVRLNVERTGQVSRLIQVQGSAENLTALLAPNACGMVFIDGDHSYQAVLRDIECADPWLANGGWMVFHDYWPVEHVPYDIEPRLLETVRAIRDSCTLESRYRPIGAVKAAMAYQKMSYPRV